MLRKEKNSFDFKYDYNILPVKHRIPFIPNPDFIGRADELVKLYLDVIGGLNKLNYAHIGIVGMGGVGKTQLAVEFTYRYAFQFEKGVYWIQGADQSKWLSQIIEIAKDLGLEVTVVAADLFWLIPVSFRIIDRSRISAQDLEQIIRTRFPGVNDNINFHYV